MFVCWNYGCNADFGRSVAICSDQGSGLCCNGPRLHRRRESSASLALAIASLLDADWAATESFPRSPIWVTGDAVAAADRFCATRSRVRFSEYRGMHDQGSDYQCNWQHFDTLRRPGANTNLHARVQAVLATIVNRQ